MTGEFEYSEVLDENEKTSNNSISEQLNEIINEQKVGQFKHYGFKVPDFECKIYEQIDNKIFGIYKRGDSWFPIYWYKTGMCLSSSLKYNLIPLKKQWWEDENNFPIIIENTILSKKVYEIVCSSEQYLILVKDGWSIVSNEFIDTLKLKDNQ